jgi:N6-adenosine-specific RNA methylase IME4
MLILPRNINARVITAYPPIPFKTWSGKGEGRSPQHHYRCEEFDELAATPVASIAAPDCFLLMWCPLRSIDWVHPLMKAWGFEFSGAGFTWIKLNKKINVAVAAALRSVADNATMSERARLEGFFMGGGYGTRHNTEVCWLWRRGNPKRKSKGVRELIIAPVREHSRKPDEIYARCEALSDGPYVELFARQQWPGWICIGDEVGKFQPQAAE